MARIRTIKPEFFKHDGLYDLEMGSGMPIRIAFAGLWTVCDREGRFEWRPRVLKTDVLPHDAVDFSKVLEALESGGFVVSYEVEGKQYGYVPSFLDHQCINTRESKSHLPDPATHVHARAGNSRVATGVNIPKPLRETVIARDGKCLRCESIEDLTVDHIFPRSMGGTHAITNLRTLCRSCNSARPVAGQALIDDLAKDELTLNDMQRTCMHVQVDGEGKGREGKGRRVADDIFVLPDWIDLRLWKSFEEMRQRLRKPMTDDGRRLAVKKLESLRAEGHSPQAVIENSVMNSYQGLFPPGTNSKPHELPPAKPVTLAEKHARQVAQA